MLTRESTLEEIFRGLTFELSRDRYRYRRSELSGRDVENDQTGARQ